MGSSESKYYCPGCAESYYGGENNWKRCISCFQQGRRDPLYCRKCFGDEWYDENGNCNACKQSSMAIAPLPGMLPVGGLRKEDIERIECERETRPDGTVWEKMTIFFRERNPEKMCHRMVR
jgi:hypothetical protein